ncbi:MAG: nucleoside triphosphate pyrophosphohydrolase, partial [Anaerolineaceae bacterium]|nr:nucleoside triphosphate pyrophosphohydrolase [Anaerolineaceae bacterium]
MQKKFQGITIIGLGPAGPELLTNQTTEWLNEIDEIYLRTGQHPAVAGLPKSLAVHTFDSYYESYEKFEDVYAAIVDEVIRIALEKGMMTYAVPGHPYVAESTTPEIVKRAKTAGISVRVLEALSFLEPTFTILGLDPFPNLVLIDALELASSNFPQFPPSRPIIVSQIYSRMIAAEVKQTLMEVFPDEHPVKLIHGAGSKNAIVEEMPLYEIDRNRNIGILTSLYVEPLPTGSSFEEF